MLGVGAANSSHLAKSSIHDLYYQDFVNNIKTGSITSNPNSTIEISKAINVHQNIDNGNEESENTGNEIRNNKNDNEIYENEDHENVSNESKDNENMISGTQKSEQQKSFEDVARKKLFTEMISKNSSFSITTKDSEPSFSTDTDSQDTDGFDQGVNKKDKKKKKKRKPKNRGEPVDTAEEYEFVLTEPESSFDAENASKKGGIRGGKSQKKKQPNGKGKKKKKSENSRSSLLGSSSINMDGKSFGESDTGGNSARKRGSNKKGKKSKKSKIKNTAPKKKKSKKSKTPQKKKPSNENSTSKISKDGPLSKVKQNQMEEGDASSVNSTASSDNDSAKKIHFHSKRKGRPLPRYMEVHSRVKEEVLSKSRTKPEQTTYGTSPLALGETTFDFNPPPK